jgi:hypothetical protein
VLDSSMKTSRLGSMLSTFFRHSARASGSCSEAANVFFSRTANSAGGVCLTVEAARQVPPREEADGEETAATNPFQRAGS